MSIPEDRVPPGVHRGEFGDALKMKKPAPDDAIDDPA